MKIKLIGIGGFLAMLLVASVNGFERITNPEDACSKELGVIHLIGECHYLTQDINQRELLKKLAKEGKIILGLEGLSEKEGREVCSTVFGIEEQFLTGTAATFMNLVILLRHIAFKKLAGIKGTSNDGNEYRDIFDSSSYCLQLMLKSIGYYRQMAILTNKDPKEILFFEAQLKENQVLKNLVQSINEDWDATWDGSGKIYRHVGTNSINDNFLDNLSSNNGEWFFLLRQAAQYLIAQSTLDKESLHALLSELNSLYEKIEICADPCKIEEILDRLATIKINQIDHLLITLRDEAFLRYICRAYNEKRHLAKAFFVIVGAKHIAFLKSKLIAQGFTVAVCETINP